MRQTSTDYADLLKPPGEPSSPPSDPREQAKIQAFLDQKTFHCPKLSSKISRDYCWVRQKPRTRHHSAYAPRYNDNPLDAYCRSGKCSLGHETLVILGVSQQPIPIQEAKRLTVAQLAQKTLARLKRTQAWATATSSPDTPRTTTRPPQNSAPRSYSDSPNSSHLQAS